VRFLPFPALFVGKLSLFGQLQRCRFSTKFIVPIGAQQQVVGLAQTGCPIVFPCWSRSSDCCCCRLCNYCSLTLKKAPYDL